MKKLHLIRALLLAPGVAFAAAPAEKPAAPSLIALRFEQQRISDFDTECPDSELRTNGGIIHGFLYRHKNMPTIIMGLGEAHSGLLLTRPQFQAQANCLETFLGDIDAMTTGKILLEELISSNNSNEPIPNNNRGILSLFVGPEVPIRQKLKNLKCLAADHRSPSLYHLDFFAHNTDKLDDKEDKDKAFKRAMHYCAWDMENGIFAGEINAVCALNPHQTPFEQKLASCIKKDLALLESGFSKIESSEALPAAKRLVFSVADLGFMHEITRALAERCPVIFLICGNGHTANIVDWLNQNSELIHIKSLGSPNKHFPATAANELEAFFALAKQHILLKPNEAAAKANVQAVNAEAQQKTNSNSASTASTAPAPSASATAAMPAASSQLQKDFDERWKFVTSMEALKKALDTAQTAGDSSAEIEARFAASPLNPVQTIPSKGSSSASTDATQNKKSDK